MTPNVGLLDRLARVVVGLGLLYMAIQGHVWGWLGVVPLATALMGFCPAYLPFGLSTCSSKTS